MAELDILFFFHTEKIDPRLNSVVVEEIVIAKKKEKMSDDTISRKKKLKMKKLKRKHRNKNKKRRHRQQRTKHDPSKGPPINCIVSKWSDWSSCSVTCGRGLVMKNRKIVTKDSNGGKPCPRKFIRKKKCKLPKCRKYLSTNIKLKNYITRSFLSRLVIVVLIINKGEV